MRGGSLCYRATSLFPKEILSINFSMVFLIMSNLLSEDRDVDDYASPWGILSPWLNIGFIFPYAIMFNSTLTTLHIMEPRFADLISLNNREKSFSKESAYRNCATPGGGLNSAGIKLYTFKKWVENSCIVSSGAFFMLLYYVSNCKGFFLSPHLSRNDVLNAAKSLMLAGERDFNHFLTYPKRLCANNHIFSSM